MGKLAILLAIAALVVIAVAAYFVINSGLAAKFIPQAPVQNDVIVSGYIKTSFTTSPSIINFTSAKTGASAFSTIDKNGHYAIAVLGNDTYNVTVYYNSLLGVSTSKNCKRVISLNATVAAFNFSMSC